MPNLPSIKPELLAPAGNFEKLETAIHYGADAVYLGGKDFSLRNFSGNFTNQELEEAVSFAHKNGVKVYVTCNIYPRSHEQISICTFLEEIGRAGADAVIISDPGVISMARHVIPEIDIHLSTQANTTNLMAAEFWKSLGIKRVNLARELTLSEIKEISEKTSIETETFVHGAMCISYSGRCLLSGFLTGRDSNRGLCSHPCRWKYSVVEEQRPGEFQYLMEDERGSYIFNSKDLCMIDHIPELLEAGITSLKIEGRMKGISYLASVVKTYREAIDYHFELGYKNSTPTDSDKTTLYGDMLSQWHRELGFIYHRPYCTGFYFGDPAETIPNYENKHVGIIHGFIGRVREALTDNRIVVDIKNRISKGDTIEILVPQNNPVKSRVLEIYNSSSTPIPTAQPNSTSILQLECSCTPLNIIRKIS